MSLRFSFAVLFVIAVLGLASGDSTAEDRIIAGKNATINKYSYTVLLLLHTSDKNKVGFCSGTIVNEKTILTNAACLYMPKLNRIEVFTRIYKLGRTFEGALNYTTAVNNIVIHEKFDLYTMVNNIALVKLNEPMNLKEKWCVPKEPKTCLTASTVKLADKKTLKGNNLEKVKGKIAGWGSIKAKKVRVPKFLQEATLQVETASACLKKWGADFKPESQLCASDSKAAPCMGDHGGPLVVEGYQVGIVNEVSCDKKQGATFTRVSHYYDWIQKNLAK